MTSIRRLRRTRETWKRYADRVAPGWSAHRSWPGEMPPLVLPPKGLLRAWARLDRERLRRNLRLEFALVAEEET